MNANQTEKPYRLLALGRLPAATRDAMGDTLGSLSGMALEPGSWRAIDGGYAGVFVTLPDRGFNVPKEGRFSDYAARVHRIGFELHGERLTLTPLSTRYLRDAGGALTTGMDPGRGLREELGAVVPSPKKGAGAGRISFDSEGLAIARDGRMFVSEEFAANIYCFAADGRMTGVISPPAAFVPHVDGKVCFTSADGTEVEHGRAPNDGFEGLSLSSDERELYALMQSPLAQDRSGPPKSRRYTRLIVHAVAGKPAIKAHYVVALPLFGEGEVAEANDILPLGRGRVLILARESYGFGAKPENRARAIAFKQIMLGDLKPASDLSGSKFERKAKPIVGKKGELADAITPVTLSPFLDLADEVELNCVGLTAKRAVKGFTLLSAKWESLVLSPPLDPAKPRERLLFVGNDNDFATRDGMMPDGAYDAGLEHDNMVLAYRVTLPG